MLVCLVENHEPPFNVRVGRPAYNDPSWAEGMSEADKMTAYIAGNRRTGVYPPGSEVIVVDETIVPSDHKCNNSCEFFDAWRLKDGKVVVDLERAREIKLGKIREARKPKLQELDISYLIALERADRSAQEEIARLKQVLRDLPATFDMSRATSVEQLKNMWPHALT